MQVKAYTSVFLKNHRYVDFVKFLWHYRVGAFSVLKKMIGLKPKDQYEQETKSRIELDSDGKKLIADATQSWQEWQVQELKRTRKVKPEILKKIKHV